MNKLFAKTLLAITFFSILTPVAKSETTDARSLSMGGAEMGVNDAYSVLRNPAGLSDLGWGSFILPLSPALNIGNSLSSESKDIYSIFMDKSSTDSSQNLSKILDILNSSSGNVNLNVNSKIPLLGFSGAPFSKFSIMGKPVSLGLNLWGRAYVGGNFTLAKDGIQTITSASSLLSDINTQINTNSDKIKGLVTGFSSLNLAKYASLDPSNSAQVKAAADDVSQVQKDTISPAITQGTEILNSFDKASSDIKNILKKIDDLSKSGSALKGDVVADGHAVIAISGASRLFSNDVFDLSLGVNLKGFVFPTSFDISNSNSAILKFLSGNSSKISSVNLKTDLQLDKFKTVDELNNVIDTQVKPLIDSGKSLIGDVKSFNDKLTPIIDKAKNGSGVSVTDFISFQGDFLNIQKKSKDLTTGLSGDFSKNLTQSIQSSLVEDLKNVKVVTTQMTDIAPMGFGADIGVQARIMDDFAVGIVAENPFVLWPAKLKKNVYGIDTNALGSKNLDPSTLLILAQEDKNPQSTNYNLSEPFALRLGGSYSLGKITPFLANSLLAADIEQVFNGRPLAFHLGVEKMFVFGPAGLGIRLGTQLGGLGNMFTAGLGAKAGAFNLNLAYGASNINPLLSSNVVGGLSTSLNF